MINITGSALLVSTLLYALFVLYIIRGLLKKATRADRSDQPPVSVVISARNEAANLPALLDDLLAQDYPAERLDIYIANDRSEDETGHILDRYAGQHPHIHPVHIRSITPGMTPKEGAITQCIHQVTSEIILTTDADCRLDSRWVSSAVRHMSDDTAVLVGASSVVGNSWFERYQNLDFLALMSANAGFIQNGIAWSGSGQNLGYRRSGFTALGGFTRKRYGFSGDDAYLVQGIPGILGQGVKFIFDPDHFIRSQPTPDVRAFLRQRMRWSHAGRPSYTLLPMLVLFLSSAFVTNILILVNSLLLAFGALFWSAVLIKLILELIVLSIGARRLHQLNALALYPLWFLLQPVYIPITAIGGLLIKHEWKS